MPRRRSTWGSNTDAGGDYRRLRYWADEHDGRGYVRHSKTIKGTRRQGDEELARLRVAHSQDRPVPTVKQAYETWWLPEARAKVASGKLTERTLANYQSRWTAHVCPALGGMPVTDVRPRVIRDWLQGMSAGVANQSLVMLRQVLDLCVLYECIDTNPARETIPSSVRAETLERDKTVYDLDTMTSAMEAARGTAAYVPAVLCGIGSCRVGEALGVRCDEVDAVEANGMTVAVVPVTRQVDREGRISERLKTAGSERVVVIPEPWSLDVLEAARRDAPGGWLTPDGVGGPLSGLAFNVAWRKAVEGAGLARIPLRNLRNSWRTIGRWELGIPEDLLEKMMGHAGKSVGEIHYDRPKAEYFADVVSRAWNDFRAAKP